MLCIEQEVEDVKQALTSLPRFAERRYEDVVDSGSPGDPGLRRDR